MEGVYKHHIISISMEPNEESAIYTTQRFIDNIDGMLFNISTQQYPSGLTKEQKKDFSRKAMNFSMKESTLYYKLKGKTGTL